MINAVILALVGSGLLAIFFDTIDWHATAQPDDDEPDQSLTAQHGDEPITVTVTDIHQWLGRFEGK